MQASFPTTRFGSAGSAAPRFKLGLPGSADVAAELMIAAIATGRSNTVNDQPSAVFMLRNVSKCVGFRITRTFALRREYAGAFCLRQPYVISKPKQLVASERLKLDSKKARFQEKSGFQFNGALAESYSGSRKEPLSVTREFSRPHS